MQMLYQMMNTQYLEMASLAELIVRSLFHYLFFSDDWFIEDAIATGNFKEGSAITSVIQRGIGGQTGPPPSPDRKKY